LAAVHLYGRLAQLQFACNLLVRAPGDDQRHDVPLARRERRETPLQSRDELGVFAPDAIAIDPCLHGIEQLLLAQGLGQELDGSRFHRPYGHRYVAVPADEYERKLNSRFRQNSLEFQTVLTRQSDVE